MLCWKNTIILLLGRSKFSTILNGNLNKNCEQFIRARQKYTELLSKINIVKLKFADGGGEQAKVRHAHHKKKLLVDDRLRILFDDGKYSEIGFFVGYGQSYGNIARAGCVMAIGKINKRLCAVSANDATVKGGTVYPIQLRKQLRLQQLTMSLRLPLIFIADSGGAYLPLQAEIFPDHDNGGRLFYNEAIIQSHGISILSLVCGSCTAGGAYIPTMCSEMGMVSKTSHIFLGGPPLVKAATGEIIEAEELGGALMHGSVSGVSDYTFMTESDGLIGIRYMISTLPNQTTCDTNVTNPVDCLFPGEDLSGLLINYTIGHDQRKTMITQILARLLDESFMHEFKAQFGTGLVTGFARISGFMVGILAAFDTLTEPDCLKGSHFVQLCGLRSIPMVSLVHTVDDCVNGDKSKDSSGSLIKAKALLMRSMATRTSKMITIVIGDAVGMDYVCLGGKSMEPDFIFGWPNAQFGFTETHLKDTDNSWVLKAAGNMVIDDIIDPQHTRMVIANYLRILNTQSNLPLKMNSQPVYRF